uniref:Suppressor of cytokine signaling 1 n=1 Tax=Pelusios castaneus TaxID=367368 RepID=A0A8C8SSD2_9SAUR
MRNVNSPWWKVGEPLRDLPQSQPTAPASPARSSPHTHFPLTPPTPFFSTDDPAGDTPLSRRNQQRGALERLEASGFYWGSLSGAEAKRLLSPHPPGAFLVRDSSDHRHLFTLSLRTAAGITNLRIQQQGAAFHLETLPGSPRPPAFTCVVQLVEHYLPLALARPLRCKVASLQELCRRAVRASIRVGTEGPDLEGLPVPRAVRNSLRC